MGLAQPEAEPAPTGDRSEVQQDAFTAKATQGDKGEPEGGGEQGAAAGQAERRNGGPEQAGGRAGAAGGGGNGKGGAGGDTDRGGADTAGAGADAGSDESEGEGGGEGGGYKKKSQYGSHMKDSVAASEFSRSKTLAEQRAYLPIYGVRRQLLNVIRDNSVRRWEGKGGHCWVGTGWRGGRLGRWGPWW
jgi:pre-mRNA-splicing factor ATP-dependent RNA helicase DHX38/PRP16